MSVEKKLRKGEQRYTVKKYTEKLFGVYDKARACYPRQMPGIGKVQQEFTDEAKAAVEADRLNKKVGITGESSSSPRSKKQKKQIPPDETVQVEELPELPDYGEIDPATAEKYVEGIL